MPSFPFYFCGPLLALIVGAPVVVSSNCDKKFIPIEVVLNTSPVMAPPITRSPQRNLRSPPPPVRASSLGLGSAFVPLWSAALIIERENHSCAF